MDTPGYPPCDIGCHVENLQRDGETLAEAARAAGFGAPVPACPGWRVRDLLKHIGYVHRWAAMYVAEGRRTWADRFSEEDILRQQLPDESLLAWFREGHTRLVGTLREADPGLACWSFLDAPSPLAFWARRQAHETAIHRVDAQQAAAGASAAALQGRSSARPDPGEAPAFGPGFAADGVDELLMGFLAREARRGSWSGPDGSLAFHADDGDSGRAHWRLECRDGKLAVARDDGPADVEVTAPAGEVYLLLWNRRPADGLACAGDLGLLTAVRGEFKVIWA